MSYKNFPIPICCHISVNVVDMFICLKCSSALTFMIPNKRPRGVTFCQGGGGIKNMKTVQKCNFLLDVDPKNDHLGALFVPLKCNK